MQGRPTIRYLTILGDSLSEQGSLNTRSVCCIPLAKFSGLSGKSLNGRFTNGWCWDDYLAAMLENKFQGANPKDINQVLVNNGNFDDFSMTEYMGTRFFELYSQGGLSAFNYKGRLSCSIPVFFSRLILESLDNERERMLADDIIFQTTDAQKDETLVIDWTGANDLITMETKPNIKAAIRAILAKMRNAEILMEKNYKHFYFLNLPDISLTPDFKAKSEEEQENAKRVTLSFNRKLNRAVRALKKQHPECTIELFDINTPFTEMYQHPEQYQLDPAKLTVSYADSPDFKIENGISPAPGYMFWNGKHPTTYVHRLFAERMYETLNNKFNMQAPSAYSEEDLSSLFKAVYLDNFAKAQSGCFGFFRTSNLYFPENGTLPLKDILKHALCEGGKRTKNVMIKLEWMNKNSDINPTIPLLVEAKFELDQERYALRI
ncbi:MAG: SGNH/GDSL hydrolase family protein [Gammaproteobacteria bacterium]